MLTSLKLVLRAAMRSPKISQVSLESGDNGRREAQPRISNEIEGGKRQRRRCEGLIRKMPIVGKVER